ncbi:hypothetical protein [Oceanobacillus damuensis]|uniref:hypothetical protein n=1 Tax=Oceanobacillus damuensis TaxID=937928 RepID=UPI00082E3C95|nr:hypothetical protein [Oceanobacillus damuensis]
MNQNRTDSKLTIDPNSHLSKNIKAKEAAEMMGVSQRFIRIGIRQKVFNFGCAVKMSSIWTYHISRKKLNGYLGE